MLTTGMQNLPEPLARAQAAYHDGTARLAPTSADRLARRVQHFASSVGLESLDYFAVVEDVHSTSGRAARRGAQTAAADIRADPGFTPHREIAAAAGFRAVRSTPLVAGHLIGMVSTHFQRPHRPSDRDLQTMKLYADFAAEALTRHLGRPSCDGPADPVGRAMVTALLDPARVREADVSVPFELWVMGRITMSFVRRAGRRGPSAQPA